MSFVDGFQGVYPAGERIVFHVEGRSPVQIEALPENGFRLSAAIFNATHSRTFGNVAGVFDPDRRAWQVAFTAPRDITGSYEIEVYLFCGQGENNCAEIYGSTAKSKMLLPLLVN